MKTSVVMRSAPSPDRRYEKADLLALAQTAYHYVRSGGDELAATIFRGLSAIDPEEAYFALGLGLASDHLGQKDAAVACYERAGRLDPGDPRADLNLAELAMDRGDFRVARDLLDRSVLKAVDRKATDLERKARALASMLRSIGPRVGGVR